MQNTFRSRRGRLFTSIGAAIAIAAGALLGAAAPASAAVSNALINPSTWQPSQQAQTVITFDSSTASTGALNDEISVEIGWGWVYQYANPQNRTSNTTHYSATHSIPSAGIGRYTCGTIGATFTSPGFVTAPVTAANVECQVSRSGNNSSDPGQQVRLVNTGVGGFTFTASEVTVTFPAPTITAPASGPATDTWRIIDVGGGVGVTVRTYVPGPDGTVSDAPTMITLTIDPNGGTCTTTQLTGLLGTWGKAPKRGDCNGSWYFEGYNTSKDGSGIWVYPDGNVAFSGDNTLHAIWLDPASVKAPGVPTNVVATGGWNTVNVTWTAPVDRGTYPITNYLVTSTPGSKVCISKLQDRKLEECQFTSLQPGTKYTFTVQALSSAGWGNKSVASNAATPYNLRVTGYDRKKGNIFKLFKSTVSANGVAPGYAAGSKVHAWYKVANGNWIEGGTTSVGVGGKFSWSREFDKKHNPSSITVAFSMEAPGKPFLKAPMWGATANGTRFSNQVVIGGVK